MLLLKIESFIHEKSRFRFKAGEIVSGKIADAVDIGPAIFNNVSMALLKSFFVIALSIRGNVLTNALSQSIWQVETRE